MAKWIPAWAIALIWLSPTPAYGWGKDGHEVVGKIAEKHLSKPARAAIDELLKDHQFTTLSDTKLVNWADAIRGSAVYKEKYPKAPQWHYINIDVATDLAKIDVAQSCADGDCVYGALKKFQAIVRDPKKPLQERREAIFFIAHFVGDFHQPLHCAERNKDKGGNLVKVGVNGETPNLHAVWDSVLVAKAMGALSTADYATRLIDKLDAEKQKAHQTGTLEEWILECHKVARVKVYLDEGAALPAEGHKLSEAYIAAGAATVEIQLTRGGLRLAQFLNDTFAPAIDEALSKRWAERVGKAVRRDGWTVEAKGNEVVVRRSKPVALIQVVPNSPDGKPTPAGEGTIQYALRFGPKLTVDEYDRLAAINAASDKEYDRLKHELKLPHKFDDILASTPEEKARLKAFRETTAKLPRHDLPDLYTPDQSVEYFHSSNGWSYPEDKAIGAECREVEQTLLRLFGMYDPAAASGNRGLGRQRK